MFSDRIRSRRFSLLQGVALLTAVLSGACYASTNRVVVSDGACVSGVRQTNGSHTTVTSVGNCGDDTDTATSCPGGTIVVTDRGGEITVASRQ